MISVPALTLEEPTEATSGVLRLVPPRKRLRGKAVAVESTRERILSAATQLFAESGFTGASMPAIAAQSGITAGAIYRHFASKAELLLEVVKRAQEVLPFSFEQSSGSADTALLPEVAARLTDPAFTLLRRLSVETHAAASRDPEVHKLLSAYTENALQKICALLEPQPQDRLGDTARAPEFTARAVIVFFTGLIHMDTLHPQLVGDQAWRKFVASHVAALLKVDSHKVRKKLPTQGRASAPNARPLGKGKRKQNG
ncbi:MAG: TetR/AcrR family transcriptional regulator [Candidatus Binatia bacterium]